MICGIAAFSSPDWSFLTEQWDVILKTLGFCSVVICVVTALVLCVSSLVERKSLALVGVFGFVFLLESVSRVLLLLTESDIFRVTSIVRNLVRISNWMFDRPTRFTWPVESSWIALGVLLVVSLTVLARRVSHMEVVA